MSYLNTFPWKRVGAWALVLGILASLFANWGAWDVFALNALWRVLIVAAGGITGWLMNIFFGNYIGMGTNVIESMGVFRFSSDVQQKIANGFIFVSALAAAILAAFIIR